QGVREAARLRAPSPARRAVEPMARLRSRGHGPLLCAAAPRGRDDQVEPAADHRGRHGLAVPERAEEGGEGMISRRAFVTRLGALAGTSATGPRSSGAAEPPPETTTIRLHRPPTIGSGICLAPQWVAEDLLMGECFTDVRYSVTGRVGANRALAAGDIDITLGFVGNWIRQIDSGDPIVVLGGGHIGCFELFASDRVRTIRDLKGKTIGVTEIDSGRHVFLLSLLSYVGMDPSRDVTLITHPPAECVKLFAAGKLDAYQAFAEEVQELRAKKIGHVMMNSTTDRPWSQYFCCMLAGNRDFVRKHPIATK